MTDPERLTAEDRAHLAYLVEWARDYPATSEVPIQLDVIIRLVTHLKRVEQALGAYADLANWDQDHWACRLGAWQGDEVGPNLARGALGLPKVEEGRLAVEHRRP